MKGRYACSTSLSSSRVPSAGRQLYRQTRASAGEALNNWRKVKVPIVVHPQSAPQALRDLLFDVFTLSVPVVRTRYVLNQCADKWKFDCQLLGPTAILRR